MNSADSSIGNLSWLAALVMLFGLLSLASYGNELLKQVVISPGSSADLGIAADCRADELEEEQLSLEECQLMVSNVRIILISSPEWFRGYQLVLSAIGIAAALYSIATSINLFNSRPPSLTMVMAGIALLLLLDIAGFVAALSTGPMLRAQYLWPLLLWIAIHLCMLAAVVRLRQQREAAS